MHSIFVNLAQPYCYSPSGPSHFKPHDQYVVCFPVFSCFLSLPLAISLFLSPLSCSFLFSSVFALLSLSLSPCLFPPFFSFPLTRLRIPGFRPKRCSLAFRSQPQRLESNSEKRGGWFRVGSPRHLVNAKVAWMPQILQVSYMVVVGIYIFPFLT